MYPCLFKFLEDVAEVYLLADDAVKILDLYPLLLHCVTVTDGHAAVVKRIVVDSHTERSTNSILTAVSLSD